MSSEMFMAACLAASLLMNLLSCYWLNEATKRLTILGSALRSTWHEMETGQIADDASNALSCSFGLELQMAGVKAAWPADEMSATDFGSLVTDWIIHTGRQDLTLREIAECVDRGDHKSADGNPYSPS